MVRSVVSRRLSIQEAGTGAAHAPDRAAGPASN
jgi:hypothetical protein